MEKFGDWWFPVLAIGVGVLVAVGLVTLIPRP